MTQAPESQAQIQRATRNCIGDAFERTAMRGGQEIAIEYQARRWRYDELNSAVNRVANRLLELGLAQGSRVAAFGKNSDAYLILWLACTRAGLIHVPVNFSLTRKELAYVLRQSGATALFADNSLSGQVDAVCTELALDVRGTLHKGAGHNGTVHSDTVHSGTVHSGHSAVSATNDARPDILAMATGDASDAPPEVALNDSDVVQILYTSGTTSDPKGAMHTHRSLMTEYAACLLHLDIQPGDRCLAALPLYHSAQMHVFSMPSLLAGAYSYLLDTPTPEAILKALKGKGLNSFFAPPTVWIALLRHEQFIDAELKHLDKLYYGASIMPEPIVHELVERLPASGLYNCYGQSEIAPLATVLMPNEHRDRPSSCGRPLNSVQTRIVDPVGGRVCAPGEQSELVHRSAQLMVGYWDKPEETERAFAGGWFHSGDLGYQDEQGYLWIVDRIKDIVNTGGVLVASRDVEDALYTHPDVDEVAVIGVPDAKWIEAIVAVVVARPGVHEDGEALLRHAREQLAPFKVPKHIYFVEQLPKNSSGKLLKRTLRDEFGNAP